MAKNKDVRIAELEDTLKQLDRRITDLKSELDDAQKLVVEQDEYVDDARSTLERWRETFDMVEVSPGRWGWSDYVNRRDELIDKYNELVRRWNKYLPVISDRQRNIGRPLAAGPGQVTDVLKRRKQGQSLREIEDETGLGLRTIRTIIDKKDGVDRSTIRRLERVAPDRAAAARERMHRRMKGGLVKSVPALIEKADELRKAAKGLK